MGKVGKAILAGVGAGLTSVGRSMALENQQKREDERLEKLDTFRERELSVREKESKLNQQRLNIANKMQTAKFNHSRFTQLMQQSEMDPEVMAKASTDLINNGMVYKNNSIEASKMQMKSAEDGRFEMAKPYAVWDMGTYNTDAAGEILTGKDGKPEYIPHQTGNGKMIFWDRDEFVTYLTKNANADEFSKYAFVEMNAKKQRELDAQNISAQAAAKSETKTGRLKDIKTQAEIDKLNREKTGDRKTPGQAPVSYRMGLGDVKVPRTAKESDNDRADQAVINKRYPGTSLDISFKIAQVQSDPVYHKAFAETIAAVIAETETEEQYLKDARELKIPVEFARDLLLEARQLEDEFADGDSEGLLTRLWDAVFNSK